MTEGLRQSHTEERQFRDESVARLREAYDRLQGRLDRAYEDRLDGRIDVEFFEHRAKRWRREQDRLQREIEAHQAADRSYVEESVQLIELAQRAQELYVAQPAREKRRLPRFVVSNSVWRDGTLEVELRQPFDVLRDVAVAAAVQGAAPGLWSPGRSTDLAD